MPPQSMAPVSGVFPADWPLRLLGIGISGNPAFAISRGSPGTPNPGRCERRRGRCDAGDDQRLKRDTAAESLILPVGVRVPGLHNISLAPANTHASGQPRERRTYYGQTATAPTTPKLANVSGASLDSPSRADMQRIASCSVRGAAFSSPSKPDARMPHRDPEPPARDDRSRIDHRTLRPSDQGVRRRRRLRSPNLLRTRPQRRVNRRGGNEPDRACHAAVSVSPVLWQRF